MYHAVHVGHLRYDESAEVKFSKTISRITFVVRNLNLTFLHF